MFFFWYRLSKICPTWSEKFYFCYYSSRTQPDFGCELYRQWAYQANPSAYINGNLKKSLKLFYAVGINKSIFILYNLKHFSSISDTKKRLITKMCLRISETWMFHPWTLPNFIPVIHPSYPLVLCRFQHIPINWLSKSDEGRGLKQGQAKAILRILNAKRKTRHSTFVSAYPDKWSV